MILKGLEIEKGMEIQYSIQNIIRFLESELSDEARVDFLARKHKDSERVYSIGFESIEPIKLRINDVYVMDELSETIKIHPDFFHPLFYGYNITNNQYTTLEGVGTERLNQRLNTNSFSHFYLSKKVLDKVVPHPLSLSVPDSISSSAIKGGIMKDFYRIINEVANSLYIEENNTSYDFIIDFNSIWDLGIANPKKESFIQKLLCEFRIIDIRYNIEELEHERLLNAFVYFVDAIAFQAQKLFGLEVAGMTEEDMLQHLVNIPFETPTNEKPILKRSRHASITDKDDLPKITFLEILLLRYLVVMINKQGTSSTSGYYFYLKSGNDEYTSLDRRVQIVSDNKGNFSINDIDFIDERKDKVHMERILSYYAHYFNGELDKHNAQKLFLSKYLLVKNTFFIKQVNEKEHLERLWRQNNYKSLGRLLYDSVFRNLSTRMMAYEMKTGEYPTFLNLIDILFVTQVLWDDTGNLSEGLNFMTTKLSLKSLIEKEDLTNTEFHYVLGGTVALSVIDSRNRKSLVKTFMRQSRTSEIFKQINKRFESSIDELIYNPWISNRLDILSSYLPNENSIKMMTNEEKFAYISGLVAGLKQHDKKLPNKTEGVNRNDN